MAIACGPSKGPEAPRDGEAGIVLPTSDAAPPVCMEQNQLGVVTRNPEVLIVFDRSGSMNAAFGAGTRYSVQTALLRNLLPQHDHIIRFGYAQFPSKATCGNGYVMSCCADRASVPIGFDQALSVIAAMDAAAPVDGNTPTAEALRLARDVYADRPEKTPDRYVLLSTDGRPTCTAQGRLSDALGPQGYSAACEDALAEVDALARDGVKVLVLGVGPGLATDPDGRPSCLAEIARRGGVLRPDGSPGFFSGAEPAALEHALRSIFGGVIRPACVTELKTAPPDPLQVRVFLDRKQVPRNRNAGWDYDPPNDPRRIRFFGQTCQELERFRFSKLEVQYGCGPPCVEEGRCE